MSKAILIETRSREAGIVVQDGVLFTFFAASSDFGALEGREFGSPAEAQRACAAHSDSRIGKHADLRAKAA